MADKLQSGNIQAVNSMEAPVFVIGAGRSGTTVFFDLLSNHPDLGFFTNYDDILCDTPLFGMARPLVDNKWWKKIGRRKSWKTVNDYSSLWPRKTEAYRFWRRYAGEEFTRGYLWRARPNEKMAAVIRAKVLRLMRLQRRRVFAAKLTGPGRIGYLRSIFPDARFIHLVRDARAQVHSTLNVGFWKAGGGDLKLWWSSDLPEAYENYLHKAEASGDPLVLAAAQWRSVVGSIRDEARRTLADDEIKEVTYEDFVSDPIATIASVWQWLELQPTSEGLEAIRSYDVRRDANEKWRTEFGSDQQAVLAHWLEGPLAG